MEIRVSISGKFQPLSLQILPAPFSLLSWHSKYFIVKTNKYSLTSKYFEFQMEQRKDGTQATLLSFSRYGERSKHSFKKSNESKQDKLK